MIYRYFENRNRRGCWRKFHLLFSLRTTSVCRKNKIDQITVLPSVKDYNCNKTMNYILWVRTRTLSCLINTHNHRNAQEPILDEIIIFFAAESLRRVISSLLVIFITWRTLPACVHHWESRRLALTAWTCPPQLDHLCSCRDEFSEPLSCRTS